MRYPGNTALRTLKYSTAGHLHRRTAGYVRLRIFLAHKRCSQAAPPSWRNSRVCTGQSRLQVTPPHTFPHMQYDPTESNKWRKGSAETQTKKQPKVSSLSRRGQRVSPPCTSIRTGARRGGGHTRWRVCGQAGQQVTTKVEPPY